jgi:hypothetical protein
MPQCVDHGDLCRAENIRAYPSLLLFVDGTVWHGGMYRGDRSVVALADWLRQVEEAHKQEEENAPLVVHMAHEGKKSVTRLVKDGWR